jgi:hypothetical protein
VQRVRSVVIGLDGAAKTTTTSLSSVSQSGRKKSENVVQPKHKVELSRNGVFFCTGYLVIWCYEKQNPTVAIPEGVIEIRDAMAKCYQTTRGEERVLQRGFKC